MKFLIGSATAQGLREHQQDSHACLKINELGIAAVADGNRKHPGGKIFSNAAIESVLSHLATKLATKKLFRNVPEELLKSIGAEAMQKAAKKVAALKDSLKCESGTTLSLLLISPAMFCAYWVGDSPIQIFRNGKISDLSHPVHTLAEMLIAEGEPRENIEAESRLHSTLTRCLGIKQCQADARSGKTSIPSLFLTGSDGVLCTLKKQQLHSLIAKNLNGSSDMQQLAEAIVKAALAAGSTDNCTVACVMAASDNFKPKNLRVTKTCK